MNIEQNSLGFEISTPTLKVLFGNRHSGLIEIKTAYPEFDFVRVKQTHSDVVLESNDSSMDYLLMADAHFSSAINLALCVITADCIPIFVNDEVTGIVAGVHAGWRGVADNIVIKTIEQLVRRGAKAEQLDVIVGPHIQKESFEVGVDVADKILGSLGSLDHAQWDLYATRNSDNKYFLDLNKILRKQLSITGVQPHKILDLKIDTFTNQEFHSHRRDKEKAGRNISFICRKV